MADKPVERIAPRSGLKTGKFRVIFTWKGVDHLVNDFHTQCEAVRVAGLVNTKERCPTYVFNFRGTMLFSVKG